jgi:hypothetical protein
MAEPTWVRLALAKYPWVVVRRAVSPEDRITVGVRGQERQQRWGGFVRKDQIAKVIGPWHVRSGLANTVRLRLPAMRSLSPTVIQLPSRASLAQSLNYLCGIGNTTRQTQDRSAQTL